MTDAKPAEAPEPHHAFDDSRRLTGASRWFSGPAVTLTPTAPLLKDPVMWDRAFAAWKAHVQAMAPALGWLDPTPLAVPHAHQPQLLFAAPPGVLFTATEVNEWAWERAALGVDAGALQGFDMAQPALQGDAAVGHFDARQRAERRADIEALRHEAALRGLPFLDDDEALSLGGGCGSSTWPRAEPPGVADVPWAALHAVPTVLVTGSNGKTSTSRLLAAMARTAGLTPGLCGTEGVVVGGQRVHGGDYSGPAGARAVLRHRAVQLAVLETARGGVLRRGLALARADVAVVTNISADHFGEYGIDNLDDLAEVKLTVARALDARGLLVLNADDPALMAAAARLPHARLPRRALFALDGAHPALVQHRAAGGATCGLQAHHDGAPRLTLHADGHDHDLGTLDTLPLALGGAAPFHGANMAAAALAAWGLGLPLAAIARTLQHFGASPADNPGRLERHTHRGATVLIDYAHNPDGLAQLLAVARALRPRRLGLLLGQAGNRDDAAIAALARVAAQGGGAAPDRIEIKDLPLMRRGRAPGEVPALLHRALQAAGLARDRVAHTDDEFGAAMALLAWAQPGDVVVLPVHTTAVREQLAAVLREMAGDGGGAS